MWLWSLSDDSLRFLLLNLKAVVKPISLRNLGIATELMWTAFTLKESWQNFSYWRWRKPWHTVENVFVYVQKVQQSLYVLKSFRIVTGQQASKSTAGLFVVRTLNWSSSGFQQKDLHSKTPCRVINNLLHGKLCNTAWHFYSSVFIFLAFQARKNRTDS